MTMAARVFRLPGSKECGIPNLYRRMIPIPRSKTSPHSVTIMQYNILAQSLIRRDQFFYCSDTALKVKRRRTNLLAELNLFQPDIVCMQEVDRFESELKPFLVRAGYATLYKQKSLHGICLLFKSSMYVVLFHSSANFVGLK